MLKWIVVAAVIVCLAAALYWPRISDVETGRTPEYSDLTAREFTGSEAQVEQAVKAALAKLDRFKLVGSGSGPGGTEVRALATERVLGWQSDVTVRIKAAGGRTRMSVRSRFRDGGWDFGANARRIRELLAAVDREIAGPKSSRRPASTDVVALGAVPVCTPVLYT